ASWCSVARALSRSVSLAVFLILIAAPTVRAQGPCHSQWFPAGDGQGYVRALAVLASGDIAAPMSPSGNYGYPWYVARWDGTGWLQLGSSTDSNIYSLAVLPNGDLVAGGEFAMIGGVNAPGIARWNGSAWSAMGSGMNGYVGALLVLPSGDL